MLGALAAQALCTHCPRQGCATDQTPSFLTTGPPAKQQGLVSSLRSSCWEPWTVPGLVPSSPARCGQSLCSSAFPPCLCLKASARIQVGEKAVWLLDRPTVSPAHPEPEGCVQALPECQEPSSLGGWVFRPGFSRARQVGSPQGAGPLSPTGPEKVHLFYELDLHWGAWTFIY